MGGTLHAESTGGVGSMFTVELPVADVPAADVLVAAPHSQQETQMVATRAPRRTALYHAWPVAEIGRQAGKQFDPRVAASVMRVIVRGELDHDDAVSRPGTYPLALHGHGGASE